MIEGNQGKKALLSIVAVLVLIVAVAGVTFAFFTYSRTGAANNIITAGKVSFVFADGNYINLTNHFPINTTAGLALSGTNNTCTFTITANTVSGATINYAVWAIPGDNANSVASIDGTQFTTKFADSEVFVNIQAQTVTNTTFSAAMTSSQGKAISTLATSASGYGTAPTNGRLLGTGTFTGTGADVSKTFTVRMWVDSSVVYVDDTTGTNHYTADAYSHLYYTMKIAVTAVQ